MKTLLIVLDFYGLGWDTVRGKSHRLKWSHVYKPKARKFKNDRLFDISLWRGEGCCW